MLSQLGKETELGEDARTARCSPWVHTHPDAPAASGVKHRGALTAWLAWLSLAYGRDVADRTEL